jgi:D-arabinose 1-dehydrogenase-like Zn-dependent alcohol dehydrogenase
VGVWGGGEELGANGVRESGISPGGEAADEQWFTERRITASNIATLTNPLSSPQGLTKVARMLADGTITARIQSVIQPDQIGEMREKLRDGSLHGKAVIRF